VTKLEHALALAAKGFKVFPIAPGKKSPPLLTGWPKRASSDAAQVREFWAAVPDANIGIHCEGMVVIDVDAKKNGHQSFELLDLTSGFSDTLTVHTPTGGKHLYYRGHAAAVPNSVEQLGPGLDVRSTGGYVVGPGSELATGAYAFEHEGVAVADAPGWLVDRLGQAAPARVEHAEPVAPAIDSAVERAQGWLASQSPALEGQGGDAHTFAVACGLRDFGVSAEQAVELLTVWNAGCVPPWSPKELGTKVDNAYKYGQNAPGTRAVLPTDFPAVETPQDAPRRAAGALRLAEFASVDRKAAGYLVKGLLQRQSYAELFGQPGEGKTFVALDLAYAVAAGAPWMDRKIHAGTVLYLAYEGIGGMRKRALALRQRHGDKDVPLFIADASFNLREQAGRKALGEVIATLPAKPVLIVVDTFARALMGGDENSAQDVGAFNGAVAALIESTGACVLIVHHSGKNKSAGARGSSALLGAIDTELEVDMQQVIASKQRDVEMSEPIGFKLVPMVVGLDEDGDELTSCVVEPAAAVAGPVHLAGNAKRGMEVLCAMSPDNKPVEVGAWRDGCAEFISTSRAQRFYDLKKVLLKKGAVIEHDNGTVTRRLV
jgi:RecA/RadA recombinase